METLDALIGKEHALFDLHREIKHFVQRIAAPVVGAAVVGCSDETEQEWLDSFLQGVARELLPRLKYGNRAPFRTANLGGRYEWGAVRIAEDHFATPESRDAFKVMVVKVNAHVAVEPGPEGPKFGTKLRYHLDTTCCGALHALLGGGDSHFLQELRETLISEGLDRIAMLNDPERVDPTYRSLFVAMASARLQARSAVLDIQDHTPASPTVYLVLPCVTLNRDGFDTELLLGAYELDYRDAHRKEHYRGLGDHPMRYRVVHPQGPLEVSDDQRDKTRVVREHRSLVAEVFASAPRPKAHITAQQEKTIAAIARDTSVGNLATGPIAKKSLEILLQVAASMDPVSAAVLLFANGAVGIHHAYRAHRLARSLDDHEAAKAIVRDLQEQVDSLPGDKARMIVDAILDPKNRIVPEHLAPSV